MPDYGYILDDGVCERLRAMYRHTIYRRDRVLRRSMFIVRRMRCFHVEFCTGNW